VPGCVIGGAATSTTIIATICSPTDQPINPSIQILEPVIKYRWKSLPREQCAGLKNYIVDKVIALSADDVIMKREQLFREKLDLVLVQVCGGTSVLMCSSGCLLKPADGRTGSCIRAFVRATLDHQARVATKLGYFYR